MLRWRSLWQSMCNEDLAISSALEPSALDIISLSRSSNLTKSLVWSCELLRRNRRLLWSPWKLRTFEVPKMSKYPRLESRRIVLKTILELWPILCFLLYSYEDIIIRESRSGGLLRTVLANFFLKSERSAVLGWWELYDRGSISLGAVPRIVLRVIWFFEKEIICADFGPPIIHGLIHNFFWQCGKSCVLSTKNWAYGKPVEFESL